MDRKFLLGRRQSMSRATLEGLERRSLMSATAGVDELSLVTPRGHTEHDHAYELDHDVEYTVLEPGTKRPTSGDTAITGTAAATTAGFQIVIRFPDSTLTPAQQAVFTAAADRWEQAITG